jgi:Cys-rich repeat protein
MSWFERASVLLALAAVVGCSSSTPAESKHAPDAGPKPASCGDGVVDPGEACDGADLAGMTCTTVFGGFASGTLGCAASCTAFDVSQCVDGGKKNAASCSAADVQSALDSAASGDTVMIPAGNCNWDTVVTLDAEQKSVALQGAGSDATLITTSVEPALWVHGAEGYGFTISKLGLSGGAHDYQGLIHIDGSAKAWRVHHVAFENQQTDSFRIFGSTYGVIDHVTVDADSWTQFMNVNDSDWTSWQRPMSYGTGQAVFAEDDRVTWPVPGGGIDGQRGCRFVVRHDEITNQIVSVHGFESGDSAAPLGIEVYANNFTIFDSVGQWDQNNLTWARLALFRGGSGLLYDNEFTVDQKIWLTSPDFALAIFRNDPQFPNSAFQPCDGTGRRFCSNLDKDWNLTGGQWVRDCAQDSDCESGFTCKWKLCSTSHMNLCAADSDCPSGETCSGTIDGPASSSAADNGYPCFMQPGFGSQMHSEPFYAWNNHVSGSSNVTPGPVPLAGEEPEVVENRDYFNEQQRPGYVAYPYPHPLVLVDR